MAEERDELTLQGGSRPMLRSARSNEISEEQERIFFETLAETCNVSRSARKAGFGLTSAYSRRKTNAAFRNAWAAAVREAYAKLELILLERAMKGTPRTVRAGGGDKTLREYSTPLAVALLKRHSDLVETYGAEHGEDELEEVRERILAKLKGLKEREDGIETKAMAGAVELLCEALRRSGALA